MLVWTRSSLSGSRLAELSKLSKLKRSEVTGVVGLASGRKSLAPRYSLI